MKVYLAADHAGFELKQYLVEQLASLEYEVEDCGAHVLDSADDYPGFVGEAARKLSADVRAGVESRAIVIGASGQGEAMAANRFKEVRCALYYGDAGEQTDMAGKQLDILASTREHNNANALSLGARFLAKEKALEGVKRWLSIGFLGEERHARRVQQLGELGPGE